jgi:ribosomal protein S18 acetylase RimI-like enzyme
MTSSESGIEITNDVTRIDPVALVELYNSVGWMENREGKLEKAAAMLERIAGSVGALDGDGRLVGFVKILSDGWLYTTIAEIIVHPDFHRRGIGRLMMERVRADWGETPIFLETFAENREFFEKCGYRTREKMIVCSKWSGRS